MGGSGNDPVGNPTGELLGRDVLPFHANLIQGAILAEAPVQPVSLQFIDGRSGEWCESVSYIGDDSLAASIWRTMRLADLCAVATFGTPKFTRGRTAAPGRRIRAARSRPCVSAEPG